MELNTEQYKSIENLGSLGWDPRMIATYLDVDADAFLTDFSDETSKVHYHYTRGRLIAQADIDRAILRRARDGSFTSIQQYKKDIYLQNIENIKKKQHFDHLASDYEKLQQYVEQGKTDQLPEKIARYFEQIDYIRSLYNKWNTRGYILNMVRLKWKNLSLKKASELYCDALNFFYCDNEVKEQTWQNIYAERLDEMAVLAREMNDLETARRLTVDAAKMRGVGKEKPQDLPSSVYDRKPVIYFIDPAVFGIDKVDRRKLAEYLDTLDLTETQRHRLRMDAGIEDVCFELIEPQTDAKDPDQQG